MAVTLGQAAIEAAQKLSEKFGIPTFDLKGAISTVPKTRSISPINVGTGAYRNESVESFTLKLSDAVSKAQTYGGKIGNTIFDAPKNVTPQDPNPKGATGNENVPITEKVKDNFGKIATDIGINPMTLALGAGIIVLGVVFLGRKR